MNSPLNLEILTKIFDELPIGIGVFRIHDLEDIKSIQYVFMNKVILYEMRKTQEEVFGKKIMEVAPEAFEHEGGRLVLETYRKVAAEGGSINLGLVEYSNDMVAGTYECSVHHIQENYVYVMLRNVTELEQTKNELELKNQELSQFAYLVSHDLRDPLNSISSLVELLKEKYQGKFDQQSAQFVEFISSAVKRMSKLISDLLDYSIIGRKKGSTKVNCGNLIQNIRQDLIEKIKDSGATIETGPLPEINGYESELRMLFQNLISNAIKFRKPDSKPFIKISAEQKDGWTFCVEDNGVGIPEKHKDKIFGVFERLHTNTEYEGTGIGLAHCKKIIDVHKGKLWVDSEPGKGSSFFFSIPNNL